jgi:hypothetical protein
VNNFEKKAGNTLDVHLDTTGTPLFVWKVNGSAINVDWGRPVLDYVITGNTSYPSSNNLVQVDDEDAVQFSLSLLSLSYCSSSLFLFCFGFAPGWHRKP